MASTSRWRRFFSSTHHWLDFHSPPYYIRKMSNHLGYTYSLSRHWCFRSASWWTLHNIRAAFLVYIISERAHQCQNDFGWKEYTKWSEESSTKRRWRFCKTYIPPACHFTDTIFVRHRNIQSKKKRVNTTSNTLLPYREQTLPFKSRQRVWPEMSEQRPAGVETAWVPGCLASMAVAVSHIELIPPTMMVLVWTGTISSRLMMIIIGRGSNHYQHSG